MSDSPSANPQPVKRVAQIILGAMLLGILSVGVAAFAMDSKPNGQSILTIFGACMAGIQIALWVFLPGLLAHRQLRDLNPLTEDEQTVCLAQAYLTKKIIGGAATGGRADFSTGSVTSSNESQRR